MQAVIFLAALNLKTYWLIFSNFIGKMNMTNIFRLYYFPASLSWWDE